MEKKGKTWRSFGVGGNPILYRRQVGKKGIESLCLKEIINLILEIYPIYRHIHTHKLAHNYSSILVVQDRKQFKYLPTGEQINITWYIHTMKYYSATKKEHNTNICYNMEERQDCAKLKLNRCKTPYTDSIYMKCLGKTFKNRKLISSSLWLELAIKYKNVQGNLGRLRKCSKTGLCWWLHNSKNLPEITELYTFNKWILWYVNCVSINLLNTQI